MPTDRELDEQAQEGEQMVWWCEYCDTEYAEYVNGCPRCHFGEPGTATSVKLRRRRLPEDDR